MAAEAAFAAFLQSCPALDLDLLARAASTCCAWRAAVADLAAQRPASVDVVLRIDRYDGGAHQQAFAGLARWLRRHAPLVRSLRPLFGARDVARDARHTRYGAARAGKVHVKAQQALAKLLRRAAGHAGPAWRLRGYVTDCMACQGVLQALPAGGLRQLRLAAPHLGLQSDPSLPSLAHIEAAIRAAPELEDLALVLTLVADFPGHVRQAQAGLAPACCAAIGALSRLTRLELAVGLSPDGARALLQALPRLPALRELHLRCSFDEPTALDLAAATAQLTQLTLGLDRRCRGGPATTLPAGLRRLQLLSKVQPHQEAAGHAGGAATPASLLRPDGLAQLTAIEVSSCRPWATAWLLPRLAALPQLAHAAFAYESLEAAAGDAAWWHQLPQLRRLRVHDGCGSPIGDDWRGHLRRVVEGLCAATGLTALQLHANALVPEADLGLYWGGCYNDEGRELTGLDYYYMEGDVMRDYAAGLAPLRAFEHIAALTQLRQLHLVTEPELFHGWEEPCWITVAPELLHGAFGDVSHLSALTRLTSLQLRGFDHLLQAQGAAPPAGPHALELLTRHVTNLVQLDLTGSQDLLGTRRAPAPCVCEAVQRAQPHLTLLRPLQQGRPTTGEPWWQWWKPLE